MEFAPKKNPRAENCTRIFKNISRLLLALLPHPESEQSQPGGILVAVHDSGPGIDPANLERVFEPFYTTKTSGIGMGLSICQSIINGHGGRLSTRANEPRGAVFQFTLPVAQQAP